MQSCLAKAVPLILILLALLLPTSGQAQERDTIGLVLAGGGARGIAHAGALKALEEMQVPVDAIGGTSMGALVGGLYASGMSAAELHTVVEEMDWKSAFEDSESREKLPIRRKSDDYDYPSSVKLTIEDSGVSIPLGFVQGQQVRQMIKELMQPVAHIRDFDQLPTPFRAVATDIETGDAYVFSEGDVVTAMRASMSLPALLAPVAHDGHLLVDGGMANNVPVDITRSMGVDRLIVIDIGTPLRTVDEIKSVVSVLDQMVGFLTRKNSERQLETLGPNDVLIRPELTGLGMLSFDESALIYQRGYDAAIAQRTELEKLALDSTAWSTYIAARSPPEMVELPVAKIVISNDSRVTDAMISIRLRQQIGQPLDRDQLLKDITEIYALDYWDIIDYELVPGSAGNELLIRASGAEENRKKLKFGLNLVTDIDGSSDLNLGLSYRVKGINAQGAELYTRFQLGDTLLLSAEFYQPVDVRARFFVAPWIGYINTEVFSLGPEFESDATLGRWRLRELRSELAVGMNVGSSSQLRAGVLRGIGDYKVELGLGTELPEDNYDTGGTFLSFRYDRLDSVYFPTSGFFLYADYEQQHTAMGASDDIERFTAVAQGAFSFGAEERNTVILTGRTGQSWNASNEPQNYYQLGGLFNVSGLAQNIASGRQMAFLMAQYQYKFTDETVIPFEFPVYLGASVEGGQLWSQRSDMDLGDLSASGSIYLGIDSPLGQVYVAYGYNEEEQSAVYLSLGWPFLTNRTRISR